MTRRTKRKRVSCKLCLLSLALLGISIISGCSGLCLVRVSAVDQETGWPVANVKLSCGAPDFKLNLSGKNGPNENYSSRHVRFWYSTWFLKWSNGFKVWAHADSDNPKYYSSRYKSYFSFPFPIVKILPIYFFRMEMPPKKNPIPLKVKEVEMPEGKSNDKNILLEKDISYDLDKGDWLPPYGQGKNVDVVFTLNKVIQGCEVREYPSGIKTNILYRYNVDVKFPGAGNGLMEAEPHAESPVKLCVAPENGYKAEVHHSFGRVSTTRYNNQNRCYYFRIRSEIDSSGKIAKAYYGKIYGDFWFEQKNDCISDICFQYYLNPTPNDRNLEWDMKNNLCPTQERIHNPQP